MNWANFLSLNVLTMIFVYFSVILRFCVVY